MFLNAGKFVHFFGCKYYGCNYYGVFGSGCWKITSVKILSIDGVRGLLDAASKRQTRSKLSPTKPVALNGRRYLETVALFSWELFVQLSVIWVGWVFWGPVCHYGQPVKRQALLAKWSMHWQFYAHLIHLHSIMVRRCCAGSSLFIFPNSIYWNFNPIIRKFDGEISGFRAEGNERSWPCALWGPLSLSQGSRGEQFSSN